MAVSLPPLLLLLLLLLLPLGVSGGDGDRSLAAHVTISAAICRATLAGKLCGMVGSAESSSRSSLHAASTWRGTCGMAQQHPAQCSGA
jgi:hypothetical protein